MHATIGNNRLRVLPIGKFAITLTPSSADESVEGVRVSINRKKMSRYPTLASWYDNSPAFRPAAMKNSSWTRSSLRAGISSRANVSG